jgi:hypothetical protein
MKKPEAKNPVTLSLSRYGVNGEKGYFLSNGNIEIVSCDEALGWDGLRWAGRFFRNEIPFQPL